MNDETTTHTERLQRAAGHVKSAEEFLQNARAVRRRAAIDAAEDGVSNARIGEELGISPIQVGRIIRS